MKPSLLLLDADVIIDLHKLKFWTSIVSHYHVCVSATVIREVTHYEDASKNHFGINLHKYVNDGSIKELHASIDCMRETIGLLSKVGLDGIDDGELESITIARMNADGLKICLIDRAAVRAAGYLKLSDRLLSFEEIVIEAGGNSSKVKLTSPKYSRKGFGQSAVDSAFALLQAEKKE